MKNTLCDFCVFLSAVTLAFGQSNGIVVGRPKVYEDEALRQMLQNAEAALARTQFIDQAGIAARSDPRPGPPLARTRSASASTDRRCRRSKQSLTRLSPIPPRLTPRARKGPQARRPLRRAPNRTSPASPATARRSDYLTALLRRRLAPVLAPASILAPPTAFSPSASNILNEQMQLTYETANLRLLLEGSLNDRYTFLSGSRVAKRRTTLGFPISVNTSSRYKKAVAEIEYACAACLAAKRPRSSPCCPASAHSMWPASPTAPSRLAAES